MPAGGKLVNEKRSTSTMILDLDKMSETHSGTCLRLFENMFR